jgi:hypothetical protein
MLAVLFCSCSKSEALARVSNNTNAAETQIRSYVVNDKWEYNYTYNADQTLKELNFYTDGELQFTEIFTYKKGRIVESLKDKADASLSVKKQYEYKGDVIVEQRIYTNGILSEIFHYEYNKENIMEKVTCKKISNSYESTQKTVITKLAEENKIKVEREGVATHVLTYDDNITPLATIPAYKAIVQINNHGLAANTLLNEIYVGDKCSTRVEEDLEWDGNQLLGSTISYKHADKVHIQETKYEYE